MSEREGCTPIAERNNLLYSLANDHLISHLLGMGMGL